MTLIELWNVFDKGLRPSDWSSVVPREIRACAPLFSPEMGVSYLHDRWVIENPERFRKWAIGTRLWSESEIQELDPYIVAFLLRD